MTSVSHLPHPLPSAALHAGCAHNLAHHPQGYAGRQDEARHDYVVDPMTIVGGSLIGEKGDAIIALAKVFYVCNSRNERVRHDGRFAQDHTHFGLAPVFLPLSLREHSKHNWSDQSNHNHCNNSSCDNYVKQLTIASSDDEQIVNPTTKDTPHSATVAS